MSEVRLEGVDFRYGDGPTVLHGVDLTFGPGVSAVMGPNGAGKSTLLRLLNGLLHPTEGKVLVAGTDTTTVTVATLARTVGLVFQHPSDQLFAGRLLDEVMAGPLNLRRDRDQARRSAEEALAEVGLAEDASRNPYDLGLAQRKLATIASVLAMDVEVVVLDEPTMGQDRAGIDRITAIVERIAAAGRTVVIVSHDAAFVARTSPRVVVLCGGAVEADDTAARVFAGSDLLARAGLEPPPATVLGRALGLPGTVLTVEALIESARRHLSRHGAIEDHE